MKKLFALLLTLAMLLSSAAMAEFDYAGLWTLTGTEAAGISIDAAAMGLNGSMLLNEDGSCVLTMQDETQNGTWAATGTGITTTDAEGVVDTYTLVNNNLVAEQEGVKLIFARGAEEEINYIGAWTLASLEVNGDVVQEPSAIGISGGVVLNEDGSCVLTMRDEMQNGTWVATETGITTTDAEGVVDTYTLVDGKLVVEVDGVRLTFVRVAEKIDYVGSWALTSAKASGMTLDPAQLGLEISLHIYEDGTCEMVSMGEMEQGTWAETEGGIVITDTSGEPLALTVMDGALIAELDGVAMIFTPVVEDEYAEPLAGLTMADFNGEWVFVDAEYMGQVLDAETLGMSAELHIQDGKGHVELVYEDGTEAYDAVCEIEEVEELGTVMYFFYTDPATGEATEYGMMLMLYNDGELVWYETDEADNDIFYCFENVANVSD